MEDIARELGRAPDRSRPKGVPHGSMGRLSTHSSWQLDVPVDSAWPGDGDDGVSASIVALGEDLARRLGSLPAGECIATLAIVQKVFGEDDTVSQGIHLRVEAMRWLVVANADIDLDQYFYDTADAPGT